MLGKRPITEELTEDTEIEEAVVRQVKRRRKVVPFTAQPPTLNVKRAICRSAITKLLKENKNLVTPWSDIMESLLEGKAQTKFQTLKSIDEFIDGFELRVNEEYTGPLLQR